MKPIYGWWFSKSKKLPHGDGRRIQIGRTHKVKPPIEICRRGLHLSIRPLDALKHTSGNIVWRVRAGGKIYQHHDKLVCSERTYIAGGIDVSDTLRKFARLCALDIIHLWNPPDVVVRYLRTGNESLRDAARNAAKDIARDTSKPAAYSTVWATTKDNMACVIAHRASWNAADAFAWNNTRDKQNRRLTRMLCEAIRKRI